MSCLRAGPGGPEVELCAYEGSRLAFRGPARRLGGRYVAALGGAETFGKGVGHPWPALLEAAAGVDVVNLGAVGAGPDAMLKDDMLRAACRAAQAVVLQVPGAQALSNPFYRVHPRRNDRFIAATPALQTLYPEVDFCDYAFTRHLLGGLCRRDPVRFARVAAALQAVWRARMAELLAGIAAPVVLLWLGDRPPLAETRLGPGSAPLLVTRGMLEALRPQTAALVEVTVPPVRPGTPEAALPGCEAHEAAARALVPVLAGLGLLPEPVAARG